MRDPINCQYCDKLCTPKRSTRRFCTDYCRIAQYNADKKALIKDKTKALKLATKTQPVPRVVSTLSPKRSAPTATPKPVIIIPKEPRENPGRQPLATEKIDSQELTLLTILREKLREAESTQARVQISYSAKKRQVVAIRNGNLSAWSGAVVGGAIGMASLIIFKSKMKNSQPAVFNMLLVLVFFFAFLGYKVGAVRGRKVDYKTPKSQSCIQELQALEAGLANINSRVDQLNTQLYTEQMQRVVPTHTTTNGAA